MAITMQGSWTLRVKSRNAALTQRFVVTGADSGNGSYDAAAGTTVFVSGAQWSINIQHRSGAQPWRDSAQRIGFPGIAGSLVRFDIRASHNGSDESSLVLSCALPADADDYIVYGTVKTYAGSGLFNPCRNDYIVIDPHQPLAELCQRHPHLCSVISRLYPERLRLPRMALPGGAPDLRPIVIPTGLPNTANGLVFQPGPEGQGPAVVKRAAFQTHTLGAGADMLSGPDFSAIAALRDTGIRFCNEARRAPGLLMRFQEYDPSPAEKLGGPYTGSGLRQDLGLAVTDELGHYIFRFSPSLPSAVGNPSRPDLIMQVLGTGLTLNYETVPYSNVANLQRIDLCVPHPLAHPSRHGSGEGVIQRIGDVVVLPSALRSVNTLDDEGRITCRDIDAPEVDNAAWRGALRLHARFGRPNAVRYAIYYRLPADAAWQAVDEPLRLDYIPRLVPGGSAVGPHLRTVAPSPEVAGRVRQPVPTYANHEGDLNWLESDLKMVLSSSFYRPADAPGPVRFRIEAYDRHDRFVPGSADEITLYLHNRPSTGEIASITMGGEPLGDCALFELGQSDAPIAVRYRAVEPDGFLAAWKLAVTRDQRHPVPLACTAGAPVAQRYTAVPPRFSGTGALPAADAQGYVDSVLQPAADAAGRRRWLPEERDFCTFAFTLSASDRVTDGRSGYPSAVLQQDLIGLSAAQVFADA